MRQTGHNPTWPSSKLAESLSLLTIHRLKSSKSCSEMTGRLLCHQLSFPWFFSSFFSENAALKCTLHFSLLFLSILQSRSCCHSCFGWPWPEDAHWSNSKRGKISIAHILWKDQFIIPSLTYPFHSFFLWWLSTVFIYLSISLLVCLWPLCPPRHTPIKIISG